MSNARARRKNASQYKAKENYGKELNHSTHYHYRNSEYYLTDTQRAILIAFTLMSLGSAVAGQYNQVQFSSTRRNPTTTFSADVNFLGQGVKSGEMQDTISATLAQNGTKISTTCYKEHGVGSSCRIDAKNSNNAIAMRSIPSTTTASRDGFNSYSATPTSTVTHYESCFNNGDMINFHESSPSSTTEVLLIERGSVNTNAQHIKHESVVDSVKSKIDVFVKADGNIDVEMRTKEVATTFNVQVPRNKGINIVATQQGAITTIQANLAGESQQVEFASIEPGCECIEEPSMTGCWEPKSKSNTGSVRQFGIYANIANDKETTVEFKTNEGSIKTSRKLI